MEIIEIPEEHALVQLNSIELRALWKAFSRARDSMDAKAFLYDFEMTAGQATELNHKLSEALDIARRTF